MILTFDTQKKIAISYYSENDGFLVVKSNTEKYETMKNYFTDPLATKLMKIEDVEGKEKQLENYTGFEEIREHKEGSIAVLMSQSGKGTLDRLYTVENKMEKAQEDIEELKESGGNVEGNEELMQLFAYSADKLTDEEIVNVPNYVEKWEPNKDYKVDKRLAYEKDGEIQLYKVIKEHTSQEDWTPDTAHSLYTPVGKPEEGTKDNPIQWVDGMESEEGKYYTDEGILYIGLENSGQGLYGKPKNLQRYFKVVE